MVRLPDAGPLTLGMEEKSVVRMIGNGNPSEKRLKQSQLPCHYFVNICRESLGSDLGENIGRGTGNFGELISVHTYRSS